MKFSAILIQNIKSTTFMMFEALSLVTLVKHIFHLKNNKPGDARNGEVRSRNNFCHGKAISITYSECACSFTNPACNAPLHCHLRPSLAPPYSSKLPHKRRDFREQVIEHKMCVSIFSTTFI
jgi:hypothetical protein